MYKPELYQECVEFHGHLCPGLAIGYKACEAAIDKLQLAPQDYPNVKCSSENASCAIDAVKVVFGSTENNQRLVIKDLKRMNFEFSIAGKPQIIRFELKPYDKKMTREETRIYLLESDITDVFDICVAKVLTKQSTIQC